MAARKLSAEIGLLTVAGLFLGLVGPYGSAREPVLSRCSYWLINIVLGGLIGLVIDALVSRRVRGELLRASLVALVMTPPVALIVIANASLRSGITPIRAAKLLPNLFWQVLIMSWAIMVLRMLVRRQPQQETLIRTLVLPAVPEAEAAFRRRLSAKRRTARLIAVEAQDHYLRVHTDLGAELISGRLMDAISELGSAHGFQVHRSWWVAGDAIHSARWRRGSGEVRLDGGIIAPVSRNGAPLLRESGWI